MAGEAQRGAEGDAVEAKGVPKEEEHLPGFASMLRDLTLVGGMVYCINLVRRADRRSSLKCICEATDIWLSARVDFVPAVDARELTWDYARKSGMISLEAARLAEAIEEETDPARQACTITGRDFCNTLTRGAVACAMSHRDCWRRLCDVEGADWALILEDDVEEFCVDFVSRLARVLLAAPEGWHLIYLGCHQGFQHGGCMHGEACPRDLAESPLRLRPACQVVAEAAGADEVTGLYGYLVSRAGARRLLDGLFPISVQVDSAIYALHSGRVGLEAYAVEWHQMLLFSPPTELSRDSDIQTFGDFRVVWRNRPSRWVPNKWGQVAEYDDEEGIELERIFLVRELNGIRQFLEMEPLGPTVFIARVTLPPCRKLRFQITFYREWNKRLHPAEPDAGPGTEASGIDHEKEVAHLWWLIDDEGILEPREEGDDFEVNLTLFPGEVFVVTWCGCD